MIDVESIIAADEIRKQAIAVEQVRDASSKWLTDYPTMKKNDIEQLAVRFLDALLLYSCYENAVKGSMDRKHGLCGC